MEHHWYCLHTMHVFWITCRESQRYMFFVSNVGGSNINGILYLVDFCEFVSRKAPIYPIWNKVEILHDVWTKGCISLTTVQAVEDILIPKEYYSCPSPHIILDLLYFHLNTAVFFNSIPGKNNRKGKNKKQKHHRLNKLHIARFTFASSVVTLRPSTFPLRGTKLSKYQEFEEASWR